MNNENSCEKFEARLEDATERGHQIALSDDLSAHVSQCAHCRESLEAVTLSQSILRSGLEPTVAPGPFFTKRVMAVIRAEEARQVAQGSIFWSPLRQLAGRIAMTAAVVVMGLTIWAYNFSSPVTSDSSSQNATAYELVPHQQLDPQPQSKDEVLTSIVERTNAR